MAKLAGDVATRMDRIVYLYRMAYTLSVQNKQRNFLNKYVYKHISLGFITIYIPIVQCT